MDGLAGRRMWMMTRGRRRMCLIWSGRRGGQVGGDRGGNLAHSDWTPYQPSNFVTVSSGKEEYTVSQDPEYQ